MREDYDSPDDIFREPSEVFEMLTMTEDSLSDSHSEHIGRNFSFR